MIIEKRVFKLNRVKFVIRSGHCQSDNGIKIIPYFYKLCTLYNNGVCNSKTKEDIERKNAFYLMHT